MTAPFGVTAVAACFRLPIRIPLLDPATLKASGIEAWAYEYVNSETLSRDNLIPSGEWEISRNWR